MSTTEQPLGTILDGLMRRYREKVPDVDRVIQLMQEAGLIDSERDIENDHIAFRTLGVPHLGLQSFEKIFLHCGYQKRDPYTFKVKKLDAFWYSPPSPHLPRIFVSELRVPSLSADARQIIQKYTARIESDPVDALDLNDGKAVDAFLHSPLWETPTWDDYQRLAEESEYAAWVIYNRYYLNHFTISVHNLPESHNTIEKFNRFLESHGLVLNDSGGKAKMSGDGLLIQSSTVAQMVDAEFADGQGGTITQSISGSYVEFAERKLLPGVELDGGKRASRDQRREGFEASNADKIFESTYSEQTGKA